MVNDLKKKILIIEDDRSLRHALEEIINRGIKLAQKGSQPEFEMFGVRE